MLTGTLPDEGPMALPIRKFHDRIVESVKANPVTIIIAETGSGKTTQISQILFDAGLGKSGVIGVTQPRRVAAVTVARRVASERGMEIGGEVGYTVRFEDMSCRSTRIKYLTDGTLLRECLEDPMLKRYSVIILDEAHERSLNTDILFGLMKGVAKAREASGNTLRLVVTSATLDGEKFSAYFDGCPVFHVPGRCYPVEVIHALDPPPDYMEACVQTCLDIHLKEPEGDILCFLTGQEQIEKACRRINEEICSMEEGACGDILVLPLYGALPPEMQARVFAKAPPNCRRCIIATNVAETSVTVDGVVYVVDPGFVKQKQYNGQTGMDTLSVVPISHVQATQRMGRAGRTRPGKCYRLYSRIFHEGDMAATTLPEIQRTSLVGCVLYLKTLSNEVDVLEFDFLDRPDGAALEDALRQLYVLDAIDADGKVTAMGRRMAELPLDPSVARAMLAAAELRCVPQMMTVAAMLSIEGEPFVRAPGAPSAPPEEVQKMDRSGRGDHTLLLALYEGWEASNFSNEYLKKYRLQQRGMRFARDVRRQLSSALGGRGGGGRGNEAAAPAAPDKGGGDKRAREGGGKDVKDRRSRSPERRRERGGDGDGKGKGKGRDRSRSRERKGGGKDQRDDAGRGVGGGAIGRRIDVEDGAGGLDALLSAIAVGYGNHLARRMAHHNGYKTFNEKAALANLHPQTSRIPGDEDGLLPEWIVYHELVSTTRPYLRGVCVLDARHVAPVLPKLQSVDVRRLSGGRRVEDAGGGGAGEATAKGGGDAKAGVATKPAKDRRNDDGAVADARARYLARKKMTAKPAKK